MKMQIYLFIFINLLNTALDHKIKTPSYLKFIKYLKVFVTFNKMHILIRLKGKLLNIFTI